MNQIQEFENTIGGRWTGITFHRQIPAGVKTVTRPMYFCEAVSASATGPLTLTKEFLSCPGGRRSLGWSSNGDKKLLATLKEKTGFSLEMARNAIHSVPKFSNGEIVAVTIGTYESPDILVSYLQPEQAMRFVWQWRSDNGGNLVVSINSLMAVCGSVAAGSYITGQVCCSFGCSQSRFHGRIGRDRLIMGFPTSLALQCF